MKTLNALVFLIASATAVALAPVPAMAQHTAFAQTTKKAHAKKASDKAASADADDPTPDITGMQPTEFRCELGNNLTIYRNANDDQQIALRWNKQLHTLMRVATTTGANRFENAKKGLVWIGIPAKGMLLDAKKGQQLANECRSPEQQQHALKADSKG